MDRFFCSEMIINKYLEKNYFLNWERKELKINLGVEGVKE